jgi:hypothetical protein
LTDTAGTKTRFGGKINPKNKIMHLLPMFSSALYIGGGSVGLLLVIVIVVLLLR